MPVSPKDALISARTNIEAAQKTRGNRHTVKYYQAAKTALSEVDVAQTDAASLKDMIAAFQDLAAVLDNSGVLLRAKAAKCRKRADSLR